ncbi:MAG: DUF5694 domain-containing protein [Micropepsaceae bacterium]
MNYKVVCGALALMLVASGASSAADEKPVEVMILATTHFDNPGRDAFNVAFDDVLSAKRQGEIAVVAEALKTFAPTAVAVEWSADAAAKDYAAFLAGTLETSRNEVVQIGFRLAAAQKLEAVHGIDVAGDLPFDALTGFLEKRGEMPRLEADLAAISTQVTDTQAVIDTQSIAAVFRRLNDPALSARDNSFYRGLVRYGAGDEQPGADMLIAWQTRNTKICARLVQVTKPGDRIIVLYGSGHAFLLRQCVSEMPGFRLIEANDYLPD